MLARRLVWLLLIPYVGWLVCAYEYHFLDGVNLLFHEAGHLFLGFFGDTAHFLGGTLAQLFFPAACAFHFLARGQRFEACIVGIWFAESLCYAAAYVGDARDQLLPLVGGHVHDWSWLLSRWGLLDHCEAIASALHGVGSLIAVGMLVLAARSLQPRARSSRRSTAAAPTQEPRPRLT